MSTEDKFIDWVRERSGQRAVPSFYRVAEAKIEKLVEDLAQNDILSIYEELQEEGKSSELWLPVLAYFQDRTSTLKLSDEQYTLLGERPLARLLKRNEVSKTLTIWCAGSGTGAEAYGIAMYLKSNIDHPERWTLKILGTDICPDNIQRAREGEISEEQMTEEFPEPWKEQFIENQDETIRFSDEIRECIEFNTLNLCDSLSSIPICDIVLMRHVVPELSDDVQLHLGAQLLNHLHPDSILIVEPEGNSPGEPGLLKAVKDKSGLFQLNRQILPPELFKRYELGDERENDDEREELLDLDPLEARERGYRKLAMTPEDYAWLIRYVRGLHLFQNIPDTVIGEICKRIELFEFDAGVAMVQSGQHGEAFFIIYDGQVDVWGHSNLLRKPTHSATLIPGNVFGEMSIILDEPANATVKGVGLTKVFALSRALFEYLLDKNNRFKDHLGSMVAERALDGGVKRSLKLSGISLPELDVDFSVLRNLFGKKRDKSESEPSKIELPESLPNDLADPAVAEATQRDYLELLKLSKELPLFQDAPLQALPPDPGQVLLYEFPTNYKLIKENNAPDAVYLIDEGRVLVSTGGRFFKKEIDLALLGRGQLVGEMSLLTDAPSIAHVTTQGEVRAFRIDRELFKSWCLESDAFRESVEDVMFEREPPGTE
ncbi:MAG: cyclic nucleotide-binding domain-containing protein [Deltaproteobacteria bacterium]|jgi:chemotaxis protein methyltransferase CheR|nr:cyclic nucleotide-binding domain-containing protein [Deltaproteobacteria bacterium]MBT6434923.1 cyclic nucleotide-binding domain-containing protein [Deltaproteobacteria bacterium]MBT6490414.1 cyclic nucleotide-binding domain-containing protein [Deltaproteobacteria bacterium]